MTLISLCEDVRFCNRQKQIPYKSDTFLYRHAIRNMLSVVHICETIDIEVKSISTIDTYQLNFLQKAQTNNRGKHKPRPLMKTSTINDTKRTIYYHLFVKIASRPVIDHMIIDRMLNVVRFVVEGSQVYDQTISSD